MITINYENIDLIVVQQDNEIFEGIKQMRGTLRVNSIEGVASFVENAQRAASQKNPVFWAGKLLKMRIDKEGYLRGTFRIRIPKDSKSMQVLVNSLDNDFEDAVGHVDELFCAQQPKNKRKLLSVA